MSLSVKPKISSVVKYQIPPFIRNNNQGFIDFLRTYYEFEEQKGTKFIRDGIGNKDVDQAIDQMLAHLKDQVLPIPVDNADQAISDELMIKFLREFYLSKGTDVSFIKLFNEIFGVDVTVDYNGEYVLKSSDNEYIGTSSVTIRNLTSSYINPSLLKGRYLYQDGTSIFVDNVNILNHDEVRDSVIGDVNANVISNLSNDDFLSVKVGDIVRSGFTIPNLTQVVSKNITNNSVILSNSCGTKLGVTIELLEATWSIDINDELSVGTPVVGDVTTTYNNIVYTFTILPIISSINVSNSGAYYLPGDSLHINGNGVGQGGSALVKDILPGEVTEVFIEDGGSGYVKNEKLTFTDSTNYNSKAIINVDEVDGYGCVLQPIMEIDTLSIIEGGHGYTVGDVIRFDVRDCNNQYPTLQVLSVTNNLLTKVNIVDNGNNYYYARAMFVSGGSNYTTVCSTDSSGNITNIPIPSTTINSVDEFYINGEGCEGTATLVDKQISSITLVSNGINYVRPVIKFYQDLSFTTPLNGNSPIVSFTTNPIDYSITSITLQSSSYFDYDNGTYYFKIVEEYGEDALAVPITSGVVTGVSITDKGEWESISITNPTTAISGTGQGLTVDCTFLLKEVVIKTPGQHYTLPVAIVDGDAEVSLTLTNGQVTSAIVLSTGGLYTKLPVVTVYDSLPTVISIADCSASKDTNIIVSTESFIDKGIKAGMAVYLLSYGVYDNAIITEVNLNTLKTDRILPVNLINSTILIIPKKGVITKVSIDYSDRGFTVLPVLSTNMDENNDNVVTNNRVPAVIYVGGPNIGAINSVNIIKNGIKYDQNTTILSEIPCVVASIGRSFSAGEYLGLATNIYPNLPNGSLDFTMGASAKIKRFDPNTSLLVLEEVNGNFDFVEGDFLIDRYGIEYEVISVKRAILTPIISAVSRKSSDFTSQSGFLSSPFIKINNGHDVNDYAYTINLTQEVVNGVKSILSASQFRDIVKGLVHPAGYKMFSKMVMDDFVSVPLSLKYNQEEVIYTLVFALSVIKVILSNTPADKKAELILNIFVRMGVQNKYPNPEFIMIIFSEMAKSLPVIDIVDEESYQSIHLNNMLGKKFLPSELDRIKFDIGNYDPQPHVVDDVTYDFESNYPSSQSDIIFTFTTIDTFKDVTFNMIEANSWGACFQNYVKDSYNIVISRI